MLRHTVPTTRHRAKMTSYFAFDTETTGLPTTRAKPKSDNLQNWDKCRVLSLAFVEFNQDHKILREKYSLVYPDNFEVAATEIHGITDEDAKTQGRPFVEVYQMFVDMVDICPKIVGHNLSFDVNVLKAEAIRRNLDQTVFDKLEEVCTLKIARGIFMKPIKLGILYEKLLGVPLDGAHNALADARAAGVVYHKMLGDPRVYNPIPIKKVIIKASDVAACVGLHSFKSPGEVMDDMWKKYNPENFKGETRMDRNLKALEASDDAQKLLKNVVNHKPKNSDEVQEIVSLASQIINQDEKLTTSQKSMVCEHLRTMMYTTHGTRNEDQTADLDETELHKDEKFYKHSVITIKGTTYEIVGRIDRYQINQDNTKTLVEIKNRTKCLFNKVRLYEMVQVQTYLQMTDITMARLVEQFNQDRKSYMIERDDQVWGDKILPGLVEYCKTLHHNMSN